MAKKKKEVSDPVETPEGAQLTSEMIPEDVSEPEQHGYAGDFEKHPKFSKFKGEK